MKSKLGNIHVAGQFTYRMIPQYDALPLHCHTSNYSQTGNYWCQIIFLFYIFGTSGIFFAYLIEHKVTDLRPVSVGSVMHTRTE